MRLRPASNKLANTNGAGQINQVMKMKIVIVILAVVCVALAIALFVNKQQWDAQHAADTHSIGDFSNQVVNATLQLNDLNQANLALTNDLSQSRQETLQFSNNLAATDSTLTNTLASLSTAQDQITNLDNQINDLEVENRALDARAAELTNTIAQLNALIEDTQNKLALSQTNNVFLQGQLQKQIAQREDLERKFNDLNVLRGQVKKIKTEMYVERRLELAQAIENSNKKGGQLLMERSAPSSTSSSAAGAAAKSASAYDLNVEVGSDGSVKVIPPMGMTNTPAK